MAIKFNRFNSFGFFLKENKIRIIIYLSVFAAVILTSCFYVFRFSHGKTPINFKNIYFVAFILGSNNFFGTLLARLLFQVIMIGIIILTYYNKWLRIIGFLILSFLVYILSVNIFALILVYGFFNTILLFLFLLIFLLANVFLFTLLCCAMINKTVVNCKNIVLYIIVALLVCVVLEILCLAIAKNFVVIIV